MAAHGPAKQSRLQKNRRNPLTTQGHKYTLGPRTNLTFRYSANNALRRETGVQEGDPNRDPSFAPVWVPPSKRKMTMDDIRRGI